MKTKITTIVFGNTRLKMLALVISLAIWFYAKGRLQEEAIVGVPLTFRLPPNFQIVHQSHARIQLDVKSSHAVIARLRDQSMQGTLAMTVNLSQVREGTIWKEVNPEWLNVDRTDMVQIHFVQMVPDNVRVNVSETIARTLPARVAVSGKPRAGYEVGGTSTTPEEVAVRGPAVLLRQMEAVPTVDVSVLDEQSNVRREVAMRTSGKVRLGTGEEVDVPFSVEPSAVVAHVNVVGHVAQREFKDVPVQLLKPLDFPFEVQIPAEYAKVSVVLDGVEEDLKGLTAASVRAYVEVDNLKDEAGVKATGSPYKRGVSLMFPPGVRITESRVEPAEITVILKKAE